MRRLSKQRLSRAAKMVAEALARVLAQTEPTPFSLEGSSVMTLRAERCLLGWPYAIADSEARQIVATALHLTGAKRPSWQDGQPIAMPLPEAHCPICEGPIYDGDRRYCGEACRRKARNLHRGRVAGFNGHSLRRKIAPPAVHLPGHRCRICGSLIDDDDEDQAARRMYCSRRCALRAGQRRYDEERNQARAAARAGATCETCGELFESVKLRTKYCSKRCREIARDRTAPVRRCQWCGSEYRKYQPPGKPPRRFCSTACQCRWNRANQIAGKPRAHSAEARRADGSG